MSAAPDAKRINVTAILALAHAEPLSPREYFLAHNDGRAPMKPLGKPCHDCAVVFGLYSEYTDELAKLDAPLVRETALRWFCHNHPNRACRGNIERLIAAGCDPLSDGTNGTTNGDSGTKNNV